MVKDVPLTSFSPFRLIRGKVATHNDLYAENEKQSKDMHEPRPQSCEMKNEE